MDAAPKWIQVKSGGQFYPLAPRMEDIHIEDIAHALANQCRFAGHTKRFYSVAEHCWLVSCVVPEEHALQGLLHDASEAFLVDVPSPVKHSPQMRGYREAESRLQRLIYTRFGVDPNEHKEVKLADMRVLVTEARDLMSPQHPEWAKYKAGWGEPLPWVIDPMTPGQARELYLSRYYDLTGKR